MYVATCAATLSLPIDNYETGRIVKADSWFGNVKTFIALTECGGITLMLVEGARKQFPRESLDTYDLEIGKWVAILLIWVVLIFRHWVFKT